MKNVCVLFFFFFFQAEDGIRDKLVTGVQTCALPISNSTSPSGVVVKTRPGMLSTSNRKLSSLARNDSAARLRSSISVVVTYHSTGASPRGLQRRRNQR